MARPTPLAPRVRLTIIAAVVVLAVLVGLVVLRPGGSGSKRPATTPTTPAPEGAVVVTDNVCAPKWTAPRSGVHTFQVANTSKAVLEVEFSRVDEQPNPVYGDIEMLAPGTTRALTVSVGPGKYAWRCSTSAGDGRLSTIESVTGPARAGQSFVPVTTGQMLQSILTFQSQVQTGLATLVTETDQLQKVADAGNLAATKAQWLTAHLAYERLGGAYDMFGDYDADINGRPDGLPGGVADPGWKGFRRLEYALWHGQPAATVKSITDALDKDVHALAAAFPVAGAPTNDLTIRVHEILENALQFELTGQTDEGSHTGLATTRANVDGARAALSAVASLLQEHSPTLLTECTSDLDAVAAALDRYHQPDGSWTPLTSLSRAQREQINGVVGHALEDLANIPDVLELSKDADE
jgi:high-affinity iron transporter